ncbi:hypothetical protein J1N35_010672 [Gossypium stocksii]|uniref:Uncharacterized protein n=1 Tax=Gossypium stocksii TaxID=47602 RepID=A0A9D4AC98_9ROSI|nr:hypothetical protein J1N35_010672 [Gossypium stocksii]
MEYLSNDAFLATWKWYSFKNVVNYHVTNSSMEKFEGKSTMHETRILLLLSDMVAFGIATTIGYELIQHHFHEMLDNLCAINRAGANYLTNIPFE